MNFTYLDYGQNFIDKIKEKKLTENTIIVFSDYFFKNTYMKNREKNILTPEPMYLTIEEFQKKIFQTSKMVLTEAKRPLTLYRIFDNQIKEKLGIENYYDIIDFADLFFKYYRELNLNLVKEPINLQEWQKESIERYEILKDRYDEFLEENEFIPSDWVENMDNFTIDEISDFKEILFVDIPYFTPLMRETIKKLSINYKIEIMVQIPENDYNEELLKVDKVSLVKDKKDINIKIYENPDEMSEILNLICGIKTRDNKIKKELFSPLPERNNYHKILPKYFITQQLHILEDTNLYKFMSLENNLLLSKEPRKRYGIPCEELRLAIDNDIFQKVYGIDEDVFEGFKRIFEQEYAYLDLEVFESLELEYFFPEEKDKVILRKAEEVFRKIYLTLKEIESYTTVSEFVEHIKNLGFENFRENRYVDIIEKFYEAVDNIKSSEKLCGKNGFKALFQRDLGVNLYTLLIKYMEGIEIKEVERDLDEAIAIVKNMSDVRLNNYGAGNFITYFIDIDTSSLPGNLKDSLNFTENQRIENSFMTFEEKKTIIKYRFIQGLFNSKRSVIFTKQNSNKDIDRSIFLDEVMIEYDLCVEQNNFLSNEEISTMLYDSLHYEDNIICEEKDKKNLELKKSLTDFDDNKLVLGAYDIINLKDCEYKFYLDKLSKIAPEDKASYGTSLRLLGIIVHKIFEKVSNEMYMKIKNHGDFNVDDEYLSGVINYILRENNMKIPTYLDLYFKEVLFPKIKSNVVDFYYKIEKEIGGKAIKLFWGEKGRTEKFDFPNENLDIFVTGRADLVMETTEGTKYIIDYKTGGRRVEQLDIYSIIMYGDESSAKKIIYNAITGEYENIEKIQITKDGLIELFNDFIERKVYARATKKGSCTNCTYKNICRREAL